MIFGDFFKALTQMFDRPFRSVLIRGILLTILLLVAAYALVLLLLDYMGADNLLRSFFGDATWYGSLLNWTGLLIMLFLSIFLMVPVASTITSLFLDEIAGAVEAKHYPQHPPLPITPFMVSLLDTIGFLGVLMLVNFLAFIMALIFSPLAPFIFWAVNGYMLGREYFSMAANRRLGRIKGKALFRRYRLQVWGAGILMAIPLSIPLVNLVVPILGAATFTHMFHRLWNPTSD